MKLLMIHGIPNDIRWVIEARVRLANEYSDSCNFYLPGFGRSTYAKKHRAKQMGVCYKCAFVTNVHARITILVVVL